MATLRIPKREKIVAAEHPSRLTSMEISPRRQKTHEGLRWKAFLRIIPGWKHTHAHKIRADCHWDTKFILEKLLLAPRNICVKSTWLMRFIKSGSWFQPTHLKHKLVKMGSSSPNRGDFFLKKNWNHHPVVYTHTWTGSLFLANQRG